jgi:ubiquinone/menaquinone biosynthesis C-methylase UbiE
MFVWILPLVLISGLVMLALVRRRMPRDIGRERADDRESTLAYDRVSRWVLFSFIRYLFVRRLRKLAPQGTLMDAGCGPGYLAVRIARELPKLNVIGIDVSTDALVLAAEHAGSLNPGRSLSFLRADVDRLPFEDNSLDFIVSTLSLHHWSEPGLSLGEMYRVLKPRGQLLIFDLRRDMPWLMFGIIRLGQRYVAPLPIRRTNGGVGSVWSSLTPREMDSLLAASPFREWSVKRGWGWAVMWSRKH